MNICGLFFVFSFIVPFNAMASLGSCPDFDTAPSFVKVHPHTYDPFVFFDPLMTEAIQTHLTSGTSPLEYETDGRYFTAEVSAGLEEEIPDFFRKTSNSLPNPRDSWCILNLSAASLLMQGDQLYGWEGDVTPFCIFGEIDNSDQKIFQKSEGTFTVRFLNVQEVNKSSDPFDWFHKNYPYPGGSQYLYASVGAPFSDFTGAFLPVHLHEQESM